MIHRQCQDDIVVVAFLNLLRAMPCLLPDMLRTPSGGEALHLDVAIIPLYSEMTLGSPGEREDIGDGKQHGCRFGGDNS